MNMGACGRRLALFASFEFDLQTLELKKRGTRLRLEDKPAQLLACLLEHAGQVVERADLIQLLWPGESHGDFDHRLNKAVNKLRFTLGDDSSAPRFIQTLSRRGYRFSGDLQIAELSPAHAPVMSSSGEAAEDILCDSAQPTSNPLPVAVAPVERAQSAVWWRRESFFWPVPIVMLALSVALVSGFAAGIWDTLSHGKTRRSVAIVSFHNLTGNPADTWLGSALSDWLTTDLSDQLRAIPSENVERVQKELGLTSASYLSPETVSSLRKNLGADLVISGSFAAVPSDSGESFRLDVRVQDAREGKTLGSVTLTGTRAEALQLASKAGLQLRTELGLPPLSAQASGYAHTALPVNTDAARLYSEGVAYLRNFDAVEASALLTQASAIEPRHVPTHAALAFAWSTLGYDARAKAEAEIAYRESKNLPREQQLMMEGLLHETNKEWGAAANAYGTVFQLYPDNIEYGLKLANAQTCSGNALLALGTVQVMRQLPEPLNEDPRIDLVESSAAASISDYRRQEQAARQAEAKARKLGAKLLVASAELQVGAALRSLGNLSQALQLWKQARETFNSAGDRRGIANSLNDEGVLLWERGESDGAKQSFRQSIDISRTTGDSGNLAFALSRLGNVDIYTRDLGEARQVFHEALDIYKRVENVAEQGYVLSLIADEEMWRDQLIDAKKTYQEALALSEAANDRSRVAGRLMDIGIVDTVQGSLNDASDSLQKSLAIYRELGEKNRVALVQNRLAIVLLWQGETSQAASIIESSLAIAREVGEANVVAEMYENLAHIQMEGTPGQAASSALAAMDRHKTNGDNHGVAVDATILAQALLLQGKVAESEVWLDRAFEILGPNPGGESGIQMFIARGQLHGHAGQIQAARTDLAQALNRARVLGAGSMEMAVRLAMVQLELESHDKNAPHDTDLLRQDAARRGFGMIAKRLERALQPSVQASFDSSRRGVRRVAMN